MAESQQINLHNTSENRAGRDDNLNENQAKGVFLDRASSLIGPFWHEFGCYSGLEHCVVEAIDKDKENVQDKVLKMFDEMRESTKNLDWSRIEDILLRLDKYQVIRQLRCKRDMLQKKFGNINFFNTNFGSSNANPPHHQQGTRNDVDLDEYEAKSNEATSIFLHKAATKIGGDYIRFGNLAGFDVNIIKADKGGVQKKAHTLLCKMKAESKEPLKWSNIKDILMNMHKNDAIRSLEKEIITIQEEYGTHAFFYIDRYSISTEAIQDANTHTEYNICVPDNDFEMKDCSNNRVLPAATQYEN